MEQKIIKYVLVIAIAILFISIFTIVYSYSSKDEEIDIYNKIDDEISYIEKQVLQMMKILNNLETENLEIVTTSNTPIVIKNRDLIDWEKVQEKIERISNDIPVITIDLTSIGIKNGDILELSSNIDDALLYAKAKDKINTLIILAKLYNLLPNYKEQYSKDSVEIEMLYIKSDILSSYALLDTEKWTDIYNIVSDAETKMSNILNSEDNLKYKNQFMNKSYILLKEYIKAVNDKNIDLCYVKFYYLIQHLY